MLNRLPWLNYDKKGFCIGPRCGECMFFSRDRRSILYDYLEIYDCFSCPHACHIWSNGRSYCCSSQFACRHFLPRLSHISLNYDEIIGEQLSLF